MSNLRGDGAVAPPDDEACTLASVCVSVTEADGVASVRPGGDAWPGACHRYCRQAMGHRHSRDEMLAAAADVARADGLAGLTFAKVAAQLGTSDRMVVYYFPSKAVLEEEVARALGAELMSVLDRAFGSERRSVDELFRAAWKVLATPQVDPTFRLFLELVGQANARRAPYDRLANEMLQLWAYWLAERVDLPTPARRSAGALALIARLDGLLLMRLTLGPKQAQQAFDEMTGGT